jgi:hypothetical protein
MNDNEEILVRQSKWSGRRVVLLYWFAIVFLGTAAAAGLGASILSPKYKFEQVDHSAYGITEPWGPENCSSCHKEEFEQWSGTWHSQFVGTKLVVNETDGTITRYPNSPFMPPTVWDNISDYAAGGGCCMSTNWDNSTGTPTVWDLGITCAACHETPGTIDASADVCSGCHVPGGNQAAGYAQSAHSASLDNLLASGHASDSCLHCMAGQATYMDMTGVDPTDSSLTDITCVTCHDPHDASINAGAKNNYLTQSPYGSQLRTATTNELCGKCHADNYELLTDTITPSNHRALDCTDCHGYRWVPGHNGTDRFGNTVWIDGAISSLNHSWTLNPPDSCGKCHGEDNTTVWTIVEADLEDVADLLTEYNDLLDNVTTKAGEAENETGVDVTKLKNAYDLIDEAEDLAGYGSVGVHNPERAAEMIEHAIDKLEEAYAAAVDAIETAEGAPAPGFEWTGVLLVLSILGIFTVLFRKKR